MKNNLPVIDDATPILVAARENATGRLTAIEGATDLPFAIARVFHVVGTDTEAVRGNHAHRACKQALFCISGRCETTIDDGTARKTIMLAPGGDGLYIPPGLWAEQRYLEEGSVLAVLCDQPYDEADYIRDYDAFLAYRQNTETE